MAAYLAYAGDLKSVAVLLLSLQKNETLSVSLKRVYGLVTVLREIACRVGCFQIKVSATKRGVESCFAYKKINYILSAFVSFF